MPKKIIIFLIIIALACTGIDMAFSKHRSANVVLDGNNTVGEKDAAAVNGSLPATEGAAKSGDDQGGINGTGNDIKDAVGDDIKGNANGAAATDSSKDETNNLPETHETDEVSDDDEASDASGSKGNPDEETVKEAGTKATEDGSAVDENTTGMNTGKDGEEKKEAGTKSPKDDTSSSAPDITGLGPADVLTMFYSYSDSPDKYNEALNLLAEDFTFKLSVLEQFGISELTKKDISGSQLSVYADLLMTAKLESIESEVRSEGTCTITYYQSVAQDGNVYRAKYFAILKEIDGKWLICSISDII